MVSPEATIKISAFGGYLTYSLFTITSHFSKELTPFDCLCSPVKRGQFSVILISNIIGYLSFLQDQTKPLSFFAQRAQFVMFSYSWRRLFR